MQFLVRKFEIITLGLGIPAIFAMAAAYLLALRIEYYYFSYHFIAVHLRFSAKMETSNKSAKQFSVYAAESKCACVCVNVYAPRLLSYPEIMRADSQRKQIHVYNLCDGGT